MANTEVKLLLKFNKIRYSNCYGVLGNSGAIVIDPGRFTEDIAAFLNDNADKSRLILITHAHFDHLLGAEELRQKTGVKIAVAVGNTEEDNVIRLGPSRLYKSEGFSLPCDDVFEDGQTVTVGDITVKVIHTPGHSTGSACFLIEDNLFSGDTLFYETVGVTTFPGGDAAQMVQSIKKLKTLDPAVKVFPGHGEFTTIEHELKHNPFMR